MSDDVDFPYRVDGRGRTALADSDDDHVRDLIEQLLFTVPGERANRPDFGCGLMQLVFEPNSVELAATIQALVQGSLQRWLGTLIRVNAVDADATDATLTVQVSYTLLASQQSRTASFTQKVAS